jgi:hypothetical protein
MDKLDGAHVFKILVMSQEQDTERAVIMTA